MLEEAWNPVGRVVLSEDAPLFGAWIMDGTSIASSPVQSVSVNANHYYLPTYPHFTMGIHNQS